MDESNIKRLKNVQMNASLKNVREQRLLDRELRNIDSSWHLELRNLTKEKLEVTREYTQLEEDKKNREYLKDQILAHETDEKKRIERLKEYADFTRDEKIKEMKAKKNIHKYDFKLQDYEKVRIRLEEVEKPMAILREVGLSKSFPPIPEQPRLSRSNSVIGELIKAKSTSETNLTQISEFGVIQRDIKTKPQYLSLPDIKFDSRKTRRFGGFRSRNMCLSAIPDIGELPEVVTPQVEKKRRYINTSMGFATGRRHTVLF